MSAWNIINEEASIILVGSFNPKIFHPEWFIRKDIVEEWDYGQDDVVSLQDLSQVAFPNERNLTVVLNQFSLKSQLSSNHLALKDLVTNTFSFLRETPISKMGMNFTSVIKIPDIEDWKRFGRDLAPQQPWENAIDYFDDLTPEKKDLLGLLNMTMSLPRPDDFKGYIRPRIQPTANLSEQTLTFSVNNHIDFIESDEPSAIEMARILEESWEGSLSLANDIINKIMDSQLGKVK